MEQWSPATDPTTRQSFCMFHKPDFYIYSHICKFLKHSKTYFSASTYKFHVEYYYQHIHKQLFNGKAVLNTKALVLCMEQYQQAASKKVASDSFCSIHEKVKHTIQFAQKVYTQCRIQIEMSTTA